MAVALSSSNPNVTVPASVTVPQGAASAGFTAAVAAVSTSQSATVTASAGGVAKTFILSVTGQGWNISGSISPSSMSAGALVTLSGGGSATATVDSSGNYVFTGLANGTYTITPSKVGYEFTPSTRSITVNGASVSGVTFTASQIQISTVPAVDTQVWGDQPKKNLKVNSATFSTAFPNELLLAFIAANDPRGPNNVSVKSVTGGGLTWTPIAQTRQQRGTSEIWRAFAPQQLTNVSVTAVLTERTTSSITVVSFTGVDTSAGDGSAAIGATASGAAASGAPRATLVTTRANSLVVGVGNDPAAAMPRIVGSGQALVHQYLAPDGSTYWVQRRSAATLSAGAQVTIDSISPASNPFNLTIAEIRAPQQAQITSTPLKTMAAETEETTVEDLADAAGARPVLSNPANGFTGSVCSPAGLARLEGSNFTTLDPQQAASAPLPDRMAGIQVKVNGSAAPLLSVSATSVTFQCPALPPGSPLGIAIESENGATRAAFQSSMQQATPGLFALNPDTAQGLVTIAGADALAMPSTDGLSGRPARKGEFLTIFANGLGETIDGLPAGLAAPADRLVLPRNAIRVLLGDIEIQPSFAGLAPGTAGLYQVNAQIPENAQGGNAAPLRIAVTLEDGTVVESNTVTIAIEGEEPQEADDEEPAE